MLNKTDYDNNLNQLLQSFIIKVEESAYQIQYFLYEEYGIAKPDYYLDDRKTWKYYLNLAGKYHMVDTPMYIYNRFINQDMKLTVENINAYPSLKEDLLKFDYSYNILVDKYPNQENLIKSILMPVDIEVALKAETGTILNYNKKALDTREYSLMYDIQKYIKGFFGRYYIVDYALVDNLYIASAFTVLAANLRLKIENLRLSRVFTYEAHDFYLANFFKSHLDIDLELNVLTDKVKMWLYKNLRYIERNTGKRKVFEIICKKILEESNIGMGEVLLIKDDATANLTGNIMEASYTTGEVKFKTNELNSRYMVNKNKTYSLEQLVKKELLLPENSKLDAEVILNNEELNISVTKNLTEKSKIVEVDDKITLRSRTIPELHVIIDNWFYYAFNGKYTYTTEINDTSINKIYSVNPKQAALMLIKLFLGLMGQEDLKLKDFKVATVLRYEKGLKASINRLFLDREVTDALVNKIYDIIPKEPTALGSMEEMQDYLLEVNDLNNLFWYVISNSGNAIVSSTIKNMQERVYKDAYLDLTIFGVHSTIDEKLAVENIEFEIPENYDYMSMIKLIIKTFTGLGFNTVDEDTVDIESFIELIKKITSYSIQILFTPVTSSSIESPYTSEEVIMLTRPLISATEATFIPLEDFYGNLFSTEFKWDDVSEVTNDLAEYIKPDCDGMFGFNYFLDKNYTKSNQYININMSKNFKCIYPYAPDIDAEATTFRNTFTESFVADLEWVDEDLYMAFATLNSPIIVESKTDAPAINMSINNKDIEFNRYNLDVIAYNYDPNIIDVEYDMPIAVDAKYRPNALGVMYKDFKEVNNLKDLITFNMSIDYTDEKFIRYEEIEDVLLFTDAGVIIKHIIDIKDEE